MTDAADRTDLGQATASGITADAVGDGPDLVLLHSLLTDRGVWDRVVPTLARSRRVWLVDLPGYRGSAKAPPDIGAYADRVAGFLDDRNMPTDTAVIGNGLGAAVALALAVRHGGRFDRLVLAGAAAQFPAGSKQAFAAMAEQVRAGGMASVVDTAVRRIFSDDYLADHPEALEERRAVLLRADPEAFATACAALRAMDLRSELDGVRNPTLVVVGDEDRATPPEQARELAVGIPDAQLVVMPRCAHAPQLQHPQSFLDAVGAFLGLHIA
jgi:3-oxoadipate enol-lactonase